MWISEQTAIISLYNINCLVFITETQCVYCAVRTGSWNIIHVKLILYSHSFSLSTFTSVCNTHFNTYHTTQHNTTYCWPRNGLVGLSPASHPEDNVRSHVNPCGICIDRTAMKQGFFLKLIRFSLLRSHSAITDGAFISLATKSVAIYNQHTNTLMCSNVIRALYLMGARSWLRHCATSREVASSIPDGVIGVFQWHNPSGRTMALGSTQPLTEIRTRCISWW